MDKNNEVVEELEVSNERGIDRIDKLIDELIKVCQEENFNLVVTVTRSCEEEKVISAVEGEINEIIGLIEITKAEIENITRMPYELLTIFGSSYKRQDGDQDG